MDQCPRGREREQPRSLWITRKPNPTTLADDPDDQRKRTMGPGRTLTYCSWTSYPVCQPNCLENTPHYSFLPSTKYICSRVNRQSFPKLYCVRSQDHAKTCTDQRISLSPGFWRVISCPGILTNLPSNFIADGYFVCESDNGSRDIGSMTPSGCPQCSPTIVLGLSRGQRLLKHIGSHMLCDPAVVHGIERYSLACGNKKGHK